MRAIEHVVSHEQNELATMAKIIEELQEVHEELHEVCQEGCQREEALHRVLENLKRKLEQGEDTDTLPTNPKHPKQN